MKAIVDRIEGDWAVMLLCEDETIKFKLPVVILQGIHEGDIVDISITKDNAATNDAKERITQIIEKLKNKKA